MKVIADTCIWSLVLRRRIAARLTQEEKQYTEMLTSLILDGHLAMLGPIRQEILSGLKETPLFERVRSTLQSLPDEPLSEDDYVEAARLSNICRAKGIASSAIDILICSVAMRRGWRILTTDQGLLRVMETLRKEKIHLLQ